jgi:hypothetical protein
LLCASVPLRLCVKISLPCIKVVIMPSRRLLVWSVVLLLILWLTRIVALEALPLHNDEGLHLTRAVEVWNLHPFWEIGDGKIINHWWIAAFYPQNAPVFVGRIATVFTGMIGLAAALAFARRLGGSRASIIIGVLWITSPLLFFYERMAFSDAEAGALGLLALLCAWEAARHGRWRDTALTGIVLALALLFKFTAAPYALSIAVILLTLGREPFPRRVQQLALIAGIVALAFVVPVAYLVYQGRGVFDVALAWVSSGGGAWQPLDTAARFWSVMVMSGFGWAWLIVAIIGLATTAIGGARLRWLLMACALPLLAILLLGREVQSRHFAATLPPLVLMTGVGIKNLTPPPPLRVQRGGVRIVYGVLFGLLAFVFGQFAWTAYDDPAEIPLPSLMAQQYVDGYASGYGIREAMLALPELATRDVPIVGSMYPDSCRRANFYAQDDKRLVCGDAPMLGAIEAALAQDGAAYVLVERGIGVDVETLDATATRLAFFNRPSETPSMASIELWLLER